MVELIVLCICIAFLSGEQFKALKEERIEQWRNEQQDLLS